jgi:exopolysaccharide production protein ExoQ
MNAQVATVVYALGIWMLFLLDRDRGDRPSKALCIPVLWLLINASRPVSEWLQAGPTMDSPNKILDGSPLDALVWAILLVAGLIVLVSRGRQVGMFLRANGPILLFFAFCALSILWSNYSFVAFKRWVKALGDVIMVLIVLSDPHRLLAVRRFLTRVGFVLVPLSVLFIKYYPELGRSYNPWTWEPAFSGVTMGKNLLGMTCLICGLGSLWCFLAACQSQKGRKRTRRLIAHVVILAMVSWLFWMANSMTSLVCFIMAGAVMAVMTRVRLARKPAVVHILVATVVLVTIFVLFLDSGGGLVRSLGRDPTLTGRTSVWNVVLSLDRSPLLGTGFESFWLGDRLLKVWDRLQEKGIQEAHNGYLEVYLNLGWVGVTLLAILIVTGYRNVIATLRRDPEGGRIKLAFFVVGLIYNFTEAGFRMMAPVWIAFLVATIVVPNADDAESPLPLASARTHTFAGQESPVGCIVGSGFRKATI